MDTTIQIKVSEPVLNLLAVLDDRPGAKPDKVRRVIEELVDHVQQGVYRPESWEHEWLTEVYGKLWLDKMEPGCPYGRANCEHIFLRPKGQQATPAQAKQGFSAMRKAVERAVNG